MIRFESDVYTFLNTYLENPTYLLSKVKINSNEFDFCFNQYYVKPNSFMSISEFLFAFSLYYVTRTSVAPSTTLF